MRSKLLGALALLTIAACLSSCADFGIPKRGFLTRYFAGSALQDSVRTTDDFVGRPTHPPIETYVGAAATTGSRGPSGSARMSSALAQTIRTCALTAHERATDVAFQGFGDATQKSVYDTTYSDCVTWHTNH